MNISAAKKYLLGQISISILLTLNELFLVPTTANRIRKVQKEKLHISEFVEFPNWMFGNYNIHKISL